MAIPIPQRPSGMTVGAADAQVKIDAFMDIQCPYSRQAWPVLLDLLDHYKAEPVSLSVQLITLSNHRQAWDVSLGMFALAGDNAKTFFDFMTFLFSKQDSFYNGVFEHKTHSDLKNLIADFAYDFAQFDREKMLVALGDSDVYNAGRTPIRFAATRAVWATPTFHINNADNVPLNEESTLEQWQAVIDPLLA